MKLPHFFNTSRQQKRPEHETVVFFYTFKQQKRLRMQDCCNFKYFMTVSKLLERTLAAQSQKKETPYNNFNCRSHFFQGLNF